MEHQGKAATGAGAQFGVLTGVQGQQVGHVVPDPDAVVVMMVHLGAASYPTLGVRGRLHFAGTPFLCGPRIPLRSGALERPIPMRISWNWLKQYIDTDLTPQQAAAVLTSTGLEVESVELHEPIKGMLRGVVVGHVLECRKHPEADRLSLCRVDVGQGEALRIVCGAPNVAAGQKVLVATVGADLCMNDGTCIVIRKSKIRGQESEGMICAEDELGLGPGHEGILVLDPSARVGTPAVDQLGLVSDHLLEIGLTPNRTDAMGHIGVARDLVTALAYRTGATPHVQWPDVTAFAQDEQAAAPIAVEVADQHACPRYAGLTLTQVKVGPSPKWLSDRLQAIGLKPINNVVDVTNYVQHELGQPLHAFDAAKLKGGRIVVRRASAGETFLTLDGKERKLDTTDLVIADAEVPACIAGVLGGADSGVSDTTTTVFLESAYFDPTTIRRTARRHGASTDASFRFERGVDPDRTVYALQRAALLLKEVAGARIASPVTDLDQRPLHNREVHLRFVDLERLTGIRIPADHVVRVLELLDFTVHEQDAHGVRVGVPAYRHDVYRPADVIEEVLRIHGFDEVPLPARLLCPPVRHEALPLEVLRERSGAHLVARGFREIMTPSLVNGERMEQSNLTNPGGLVRLKNPLSAELDVLRPTLLPGTLQAVAYNANRQRNDLRFFERGRTYRNAPEGIVERETLSLALSGRRWRDRWRSNARKVELADVKEEVEALVERMGIGDHAHWSDMEHALLAPAHGLFIHGRCVGVAGEVNGDQRKRHDVGQPVFYAELDEEALREACLAAPIAFQEPSRFPAVRRDLSLLLDRHMPFDELRKLAFTAERKILKSVDLFDVYQGDKVPAGKKSYALSFVLQDTGATLTDEQVEKAMGRIRKALAGAGAELRG